MSQSIYSDINSKLATANKDIFLSTDANAINNSIFNILTTRKGSVPGKADFGSDLENILFEVLDDITFALAEDMIVNEIEKWEPRVIVENVHFQSNTDMGQLVITLQYRIIQNNEIASTIVKLEL